jgi:hypothetical protein
VDFERSILRLRLDDMASDEFIEFGFRPWPEDYDKQPSEVEITSAHISFVGPRARVGFRFGVKHKASRFGVTQDELDNLRSQEYPRARQDVAFLNEARKRLIDTFGGRDGEMRVLSVDLGEKRGYAALFEGRNVLHVEPLKISKSDKLTSGDEDTQQHGARGRNEAEATRKPGLGLTRQHVGLHQKSFSESAKEIATKRAALSDDPSVPATLGVHDMRTLTRHVRWMIRDWSRLNAKQIVEIAERAEADVIVFESQRGFSAPGYDEVRKTDKKIGKAFFAYGSVRRKVAEKAVERGMRVVTVPYRYSSQVCSACGRRQEGTTALKKRKTGKRLFTCEHDGCTLHKEGMNSDENAARVLGRVFWGEIELPNSP